MGKCWPRETSSGTLNFNIAANRNRVVSLLGLDNDKDGKEDDLVASGLFIGQPIGAIYDYESGGIIQLGEEAPKGFFVGTHRIIDQNSDGFIDANDRVIRGRTEPAYNFGLLNEFTYRDFTFRFFHQCHPRVARTATWDKICQTDWASATTSGATTSGAN